MAIKSPPFELVKPNEHEENIIEEGRKRQLGAISARTELAAMADQWEAMSTDEFNAAVAEEFSPSVEADGGSAEVSRGEYDRLREENALLLEKLGDLNERFDAEVARGESVQAQLNEIMDLLKAGSGAEAVEVKVKEAEPTVEDKYDNLRQLDGEIGEINKDIRSLQGSGFGAEDTLGLGDLNEKRQALYQQREELFQELMSQSAASAEVESTEASPEVLKEATDEALLGEFAKRTAETGEQALEQLGEQDGSEAADDAAQRLSDEIDRLNQAATEAGAPQPEAATPRDVGEMLKRQRGVDEEQSTVSAASETIEDAAEPEATAGGSDGGAESGGGEGGSGGGGGHEGPGDDGEDAPDDGEEEPDSGETQDIPADDKEAEADVKQPGWIKRWMSKAALGWHDARSAAGDEAFKEYRESVGGREERMKDHRKQAREKLGDDANELEMSKEIKRLEKEYNESIGNTGLAWLNNLRKESFKRVRRGEFETDEEYDVAKRHRRKVRLGAIAITMPLVATAGFGALRLFGSGHELSVDGFDSDADAGGVEFTPDTWSEQPGDPAGVDPVEVDVNDGLGGPQNVDEREALIGDSVQWESDPEAVTIETANGETLVLHPTEIEGVGVAMDGTEYDIFSGREAWGDHEPINPKDAWAVSNPLEGETGAEAWQSYESKLITEKAVLAETVSGMEGLPGFSLDNGMSGDEILEALKSGEIEHKELYMRLMAYFEEKDISFEAGTYSGNYITTSMTDLDGNGSRDLFNWMIYREDTDVMYMVSSDPEMQVALDGVFMRVECSQFGIAEGSPVPQDWGDRPTIPKEPAVPPEGPSAPPETPEIPETPEVPDEPEEEIVVDIPDEPEEESTPEPEIPEEPEVPEVPETPEVPTDSYDDSKQWDGGVDRADGIDPETVTYSPEKDDTVDPAISGNNTASPSIGEQGAAIQKPMQEEQTIVSEGAKASSKTEPTAAPEAGVGSHTTGDTNRTAENADEAARIAQQEAAQQASNQLADRDAETVSTPEGMAEEVADIQSNIDPETGRPLGS